MTASPRPNPHLPPSLTLAGAGKMGGALLRGWVAGGLDPSGTVVIDPQIGPDVATYCAEHGITLNPDPAPPADVLVLAIKPQMLDAASPALAKLAGPDTLVVSILAGKTLADLALRLPFARAFVRAMPNLPASIGRGATGAIAGQAVSPERKRQADSLLACAGLVEWVENEPLIDAVTAVSGSGPAYAFLLAEALAEAGAEAGLPPDMAARLARATIAGAGALLDASLIEAGQLRRDVTSPGGTTAAALDVLMRQGGLPDLLREAVDAARRRASELAG